MKGTMRLFAEDVAVSLADDAFLFTTRARPEPLAVPAFLAVRADTRQVLAIGEEARRMKGYVRDNFIVVGVMAEGGLRDYEAAVALFRFGLRKLFGPSLFLIRPRVVMAVHNAENNRIAVRNMAIAGGARQAYLMDMGMATAWGMRLEVHQPALNAVLVVSDDWFDFSVLSLSGVLCEANGAIGTKTFVEDIQNHVAYARQFRPEASSVESHLMTAGVMPSATIAVAGWEVWAGKTEHGRVGSQTLQNNDIAIGLLPSLIRMTERIKHAIRSLTNEQQVQITRTTIHATGSATKIPGLVQIIAAQIGHAVTVFPGDVHPSIEGAKFVLDQNLWRMLKLVIV